MSKLNYTDKFEKTLRNMIQKYPYYVEFMLRCKRSFTREIPTAGVEVRSTGINLYLNDAWMNSLTQNEQIGVLTHEIQHCLSNHYEREKELEQGFDRTKDEKGDYLDKIKKMMKATRLNVAEDVAINEYIPDIPKKMAILDKEGNPMIDPETGKKMEGEACTVENLRKKYPQLDIKSQMPMEYYYHILKDQETDNGEERIQLITVDCHEDMNPENLDKEFMKDVVKRVANSAAEATKERHAGNIPQEIQQLLDALNFSPKDWRSDLRQFVSRACDAVIDVTRKRKNRRYGLLYPGKINIPQLHLAVIADNSGSVSPDEFSQFVAELTGINQAGATITFIECDAAVNYVGKFDPRRKLHRHGNGGTCMAPAFKLIKTKEFIKKYGEVDGIILLSDAEIFDVPEIEKPKVPFLLAAIGESKNPFPWGRETRIKINRKAK